MTILFDQFSFDEGSGELTNAEGRTRLQPQAVAALQLLLDNAGEVVSRETFKATLWPETTVEFDDSLNFCIRQLRIALGDDANAPRFIETLPKRGYRFIVPVVRPADIDGDVADVDDDADVESAADLDEPTDRRGRYALSAGLLLIYLAFLAYSKFRGGETSVVIDAPAPAPSGQVVAILPLRSDSTTADFGRQLTEAIVTMVTTRAPAEAKVVGPLSTARFDGLVTSVDSLSKILGATHILSGSVHTDPGGVMIFAQLVRVSDGKHILAKRMVLANTPAQASAAGDSVSLAALSRLTAPQ